MVRVEDEIGMVRDLRGPVSRAVEKPPTSYTPDLIAFLRNEYESGKTAREIGRDYHLDRAAVMKHLRTSGAKIRSQGLTQAQAASAAEMYQSGLTLVEVGARFNVSAGTIGRCLKQESIRLRPPLIKAYRLGELL